MTQTPVSETQRSQLTWRASWQYKGKNLGQRIRSSYQDSIDFSFHRLTHNKAEGKSEWECCELAYTHPRPQSFHSQLWLSPCVELHSHRWLALNTIRTGPPVISLPPKDPFYSSLRACHCVREENTEACWCSKALDTEAGSLASSAPCLPKCHLFSNTANCCLSEIYKNIWTLKTVSSISTGCHTYQSSKISHLPKCGSRHRLLWSVFTVQILSASKSCFTGEMMLCCSLSKPFLSSGFTPLAFSGSLQAPPSPWVWLQDCPPGLRQWIVSVCAHHSSWCSEMGSGWWAVWS